MKEKWAGLGKLLWGVQACGRGSMTSRRKMLIKILNYLSLVTVFPSLGAVGSWEEVLLFSMDFTVSQNFMEFVLQDANFSLKKLVLALLTACVYWFLMSLKSCISQELFDANAVRRQDVFVLVKGSQVWSEATGYICSWFYIFVNGACLFKMERKALLNNNQASSTDEVNILPGYPGQVD